MMRLGLFGGTFAPFHNGHLRALCTFREQARLDRVIVMPTGIPPHKQKTSLFSDEERLALTRAACAGIDRCTVSDREIRQRGRSYTSRTTAYLQTRYPGAKLILYVGSDMFLSFHRWHRPDAILDRASLFVLSRTGDDIAALERQARFLQERFAHAECVICPAEPLRMSSSQIRELWLNGGDVRDLVPAPVYEYLRRKERPQ